MGLMIATRLSSRKQLLHHILVLPILVHTVAYQKAVGRRRDKKDRS